MEKTLEERFEVLEKLFRSEEFLENRGLGNEVGYYIFDYDPKLELSVRENIQRIKRQNSLENDGYEIKVFNLYKIMMELLESKKYTNKIIEFEKKHDISFLATRINRVLKMEEFDDSEMYFTKYIQDRVDEKTIVILTGIGELYPLVRAHSVLNKMHLVYNKRPVIMMYPGSYDRLKLTILNTNREANYYRAFRVY